MSFEIEMKNEMSYPQIHRRIVEVSSHVRRLDHTIQRVLNRQVFRVALDDSKSCANGVEISVIRPRDDRAVNFARGVESVEPSVLRSCVEPNFGTMYYVGRPLRDLWGAG